MKRARYLLADAFPPPAGPHGVGQRLVPPLDRETSPDLEVRLFYPLETSAASRRRSRHPDVAVEDATGAAGEFPTVLYFGGWPGNAIDNYALICELVSHGMRVATLIYPKADGPMDYSSETAYLRTVSESNRLVHARAEDAIGLLDRLAPRRAALLGFSFGGAVAAEAALLDKRFCAAVNIDGRPWGRALHEGVSSPFLFIGGDRPMPSADDLTHRNPDRRYNARLDVVDIENLSANLRRHGGIHVTVSKADHLDFTDGAARWSGRRLLGLKAGDPRHVLRAAKSHVVAFLSHAFGMRTSPLPEAPGVPGALVEVYPRPEAVSARRESSHEDPDEVWQHKRDGAHV